MNLWEATGLILGLASYIETARVLSKALSTPNVVKNITKWHWVKINLPTQAVSSFAASFLLLPSIFLTKLILPEVSNIKYLIQRNYLQPGEHLQQLLISGLSYLWNTNLLAIHQIWPYKDVTTIFVYQGK